VHYEWLSKAERKLYRSAQYEKVNGDGYGGFKKPD